MSVRRWLRIGAIAAAILVAAVALAFIVLQTGPGRSLTVAAIESAASSNNFKITIEGLEGTLPGGPQVAKVTLADAQGPWLVLQDVRVSWSPFALVFGEIAIDELKVARADWLREPIGGGDGGGDDDGGLPAIAIGRFNIAAANIAATIAKTPGTLSIEGAVDLLDPSEAATIVLKVAEVGGAAHVDADIRYARADALLAAKVSVDDRAGGVIASLAGLPADAPLSVRVTSDGPLDNWRAKLVAQGGSALSATGNANIRREGDWWRLDLGLDADATTVGPVAWQPLVQGHTRLTMTAARSVSGGIRIDALHLDSPAATAEASGIYDPAAEKASGSASVNVADGARLTPILGAGVTLRDLKATARLGGAWPKAALDIEATANALRTDSARAETVVIAAHAVPDRPWDDAAAILAVTANVQAGGVASESATIARVLGPSVTLKAQTSIDGYKRYSHLVLDLFVSAGALQFAGDVDEDSVRGDLTLDASDLARAGAKSGRALMRTRLSLDRATRAWELEGVGSTDALVTGERAVDGLLRGKTELQFTLGGPSLASARIGKLAVTNQQIALQASGTAAPDKLDIDASVSLPEIAVLTSDAAGRTEGKLHLSGPASEPQIDGTVSLIQGKVRGQASQLLMLRLAKADANGVGEATLEGDLGGKAVAVRSEVAWNDPAGLHFNQAHIAVGAVALDGSFALREGMLDGTLKVDAGALQDIAPLVDVDLAGRATGTLTFAAAKQQVLNVALTSPDARIDAARLSGLKVSGQLLDPFGTTVLDLSAHAASADIDGFALTRVDAAAKGGLRAMDVSLKGLREEAALAAQGRLDVDEKPTRIALNTLTLSRGAKQARLQAPVALTIADGDVVIPGARIGAGGGTLSIAGRAGRELDLALQMDRVPLWVADFVTDPLPVSGLATGTAKMTGPARELRGSFDLKIANLTPEDARGVARNLTLAATGATTRSGLDFKAILSDPRGTTLNAAGRVPFADSGALAIDIQGTGELALANIYLSATGDRTRGKLSVAAKISGTLAAPRVSGTGTIKDGFFRSAQAGLELRDVSARLEGSERRIAVTELSAKAPNGGTLNGTGEIRLDRAGGFPIDIAVKAANAQLVATDVTTVSAGLDVKMTGGLLTNPTIRGSVDIAQWDIRVPGRLARPLTPIRVTHRNAPAYVAEQAAVEQRDEAESAFSFALDLTVRAPRRVFVRGQGIDAEFGGSAKVSGTVDDPVINGRFDLKRGAISMLSQRVALTRGAVVFSGDVEPTLDVAGTVSKNDIVATISAKGRASDPVLVLSSTPTLPQDEILSRILFGKGTQQLSAFEAAQLAGSIAQWSGLSTGPDILDKLRTALGIDALSTTTDAKGSTAVSAGSYVGGGVFLGMTQGAATESGAANVEVELDDNIKVRGEAGATGNAKLGVVAEWEY